MTKVISANTQYNDYRGMIAIDKTVNTDIEDLFREKGIDLDENHVVSFTFNLNRGVISLYANTTNLSYEDILEYAEIGENIPIKVYYFSITLEEFLTYVKRLNFTVTDKYDIQEVEVNVIEEIAV